MNKLRRITSLTALLSAVFILLTSVVLYVVPQGRVAYWADWRLGGLTKTQWTNLHINLGVLFLLAVVLHVYLNWKPILSYLKTKTRKMRILTREFNVAMGVTAVFLGAPTSRFRLSARSWMSVKDSRTGRPSNTENLPMAMPSCLP